jgi:hypothetical protein
MSFMYTLYKVDVKQRININSARISGLMHNKVDFMDNRKKGPDFSGPFGQSERNRMST